MRREMSALRGVAFSIISNDCWGGEVYRLSGREYNTPFVGLFTEGACYAAILEDLDAALSSELIEVTESRYFRHRAATHPIGLLTAVDAELHFLHYPSFTEAQAKWRRRAARVDRDALFVKSVIFDHGEVGGYAALPYAHKLIAATQPVPGVNTAVGRNRGDAVLDFRSAAVRFDVVDWLTGGSGQVPPRRLPGRWLRYAGW
jgi:uncharacterized protein (DUF1919 family)